MNGPAMNGPAMIDAAVTDAAKIGRVYTGRHRRDSGPGPLRPDPAGSTARSRAEPDGRPLPGPGSAPALRSDAG